VRELSRAFALAVPHDEALRIRDDREANARGDKLGLSEDELAFYDALETNDSAVTTARRPPERTATGSEMGATEPNWRRPDPFGSPTAN